MAPVKDGDRNHGSILGYFKSLALPSSKCASNDEPADEIQVATSSTARPTTDAGNRGPSPLSREGMPQKRRGRPPKVKVAHSAPSPKSQHSSAGDDHVDAPRKRGRPKKTEAQQMRDHRWSRGSSPSFAIPSRRTLSTNASSPVEESKPRFNIDPLDGIANVTPTNDSPYRSPSDSPAKRRLIHVIELSSSSSAKNQPGVVEMSSSSFTKPQTETMETTSSSATEPSASIPKQHQVARSRTVSPSTVTSAPASTFDTGPPAATQAATTLTSQPPTASSNSTSTLAAAASSSIRSGAPMSSSTSSKRCMTRDGLKAVRDSDSEGESSSGDELPSWQSFVKPRTPAPPPTKRVRLSPSDDAISTKRSDQSSRQSKFEATPKSPPQSKFRKSLADLVAEQEQWQLSRATVESLESSVAQAKIQEQDDRNLAHDGVIDGELLLGTADSDEQDRMIKALERTEALQDEEHFYFFYDRAPKVKDRPLEWPCAPDSPWSTLLPGDTAENANEDDMSSWTNACLSGLAAIIVSQHPLPPPVTAWMIAQLCYEPHEALRDSYTEILRASVEHAGSVSDSWAAFSNTYCIRSLFPGGIREKGEPGVPPGLKHIMQLVQHLAPAVDLPDAYPSWTCEAFADLAMMNVDENVHADASLSRSIAVSIQAMLDELSEESFRDLISAAVREFFSSSDLPARIRCQAIFALPVGTARAAKIRRQLALHHFSTAASRKSPDSQDWPRLILNALEASPQLQINPATDYRLLTDLIAVLDIAISGGWIDHSQLVVEQPAGAWGERPPPTQAEKEHNSHIDKICARLRTSASKIHDSGASHLRRTEAKTAIERLVVRLEHNVRTRPKPKQSVFGGFERALALEPSFKQATFSKSSFIKQEPSRLSVPTAQIRIPAASSTSSSPTPNCTDLVNIVDETPEDDASGSSLSSLEDNASGSILSSLEDYASGSSLSSLEDADL